MKLYWLQPILIVFASAIAFASNAAADVIFNLDSNEYPTVNANRDQAWQTAVGNSFTEVDLDDISGTHVDSFLVGSVNLNVGLFDPTFGTSSTAELFHSDFSVGGGSYGTVHDGTFLNRDAAGLAYEQITFSFSTPVRGFGAWIFDDVGTDATYELIVSEVGGSNSTSTVLDGGNGTNYFVEGFMGVTSEVGLTAVSIRAINPQGTGFFEVDHLQLSAVPEPSSIAMLLAGFTVAFTRLRGRRANFHHRVTKR